MKITLSNKVQIKDGSPSILSEVKSRLTIVNPAWVKNEKMGRWQGETPGKEKAVVYDYVDKFVGVLKAAAVSRRRVYGQY
jgi:hypothetical protein